MMTLSACVYQDGLEIHVRKILMSVPLILVLIMVHVWICLMAIIVCVQ